MVRPRAELGSLRFSRLEKERLLLALLFSLLAHLGIWGGYEAGKKTGLWNRLHWPVRHQAQLVQPKPPMDTAQPTIFVDVSEPDVEPPKEAKYYSDKNSRAANPTAEVDSNVPKIIGTQKDVPKTEDTPRTVKAPPAKPVQPSKPDQPNPAKNDLAHALNPGNLDKANPAETPEPETKPPTPERPRTLKEARALQPDLIVGQKMQQNGGVRHHSLKSSLDAISTPFGAYDRAIIEAVQQRWDDLLYTQNFAYDRAGKVTVYFHLNPDDSVTESKIVTSSVGELLAYYCQEAIARAAPFGKWPPDMRRMVGGNFREITFTFYYY